MDNYQINFGHHVLSVPWWWYDALLGWLGVMGLILYFLGHRLVRPSFALMGLLGGAGMSLLAVNGWVVHQWPTASPGPFVAVGALVGAVAAYLLWRLEVGVVMAVVAGLIAPVGYMLVMQIPPPALGEPLSQGWEELRTVLATGNTQAADPSQIPVVLEPIHRTCMSMVEVFQLWWGALGANPQWMIGALGVGGATAAMFIGFALPRFCSMFCTSLFGVLLLSGGVYRLGGLWAWLGSTLPTEPKNIGLAVLVATLVGVAIQSALTCKRRGKESK